MVASQAWLAAAAAVPSRHVILAPGPSHVTLLSRRVFLLSRHFSPHQRFQSFSTASGPHLVAGELGSLTEVVCERYSLQGRRPECRFAAPRAQYHAGSVSQCPYTLYDAMQRKWTETCQVPVPEETRSQPAREWRIRCRQHFIGGRGERTFTMARENFPRPSHPTPKHPAAGDSSARLDAPPADARMMAHLLQTPIHPWNGWLFR